MLLILRSVACVLVYLSTVMQFYPMLVEEEVEVGEGEKVGRLCSPKLVEPASTEEPATGPGRRMTC